jgi:hypothetical protein
MTTMGTHWEVREEDWDRLARNVRKILKDYARRGATLQYRPLAARFPELEGPNSHALHQLLGEISTEAHATGNGLLSAVVVAKATGIPGPGFFDWAKTLGYSVGDDPSDRKRFWKERLEEVYAAAATS